MIVGVVVVVNHHVGPVLIPQARRTSIAHESRKSKLFYVMRRGEERRGGKVKDISEVRWRLSMSRGWKF